MLKNLVTYTNFLWTILNEWLLGQEMLEKETNGLQMHDLYELKTFVSSFYFKSSKVEIFDV